MTRMETMRSSPLAYLNLSIVVERLQFGPDQFEQHATLLIEFLLETGHIDLDQQRLGQTCLCAGDATQCMQHALIDGRGHFEMQLPRRLCVCVCVCACLSVCVAC